MPLLFTRFRLISIAVFAILIFSRCKKSVDQIPVDPNTIIETEPATLLPVSLRISQVIGGYYVGLPVHYSETTKNYPVIIFLHGLGQMGNGESDLPYIITDGIGKVLKDKKLPPNFPVGNKNLSFIVFSPQTSDKPSVFDIGAFYEYIIKTYRIDRSRIYLSGLSLGARVTTLEAAEFPEVFAALVPIAGVAINPGIDERCEKIAMGNLPVWLLHNEDDPLSNISDAKYFVEKINSFNPVSSAKITIFPVYGHDAWTTALDPTYKENGLNIYEWMLQHTR